MKKILCLAALMSFGLAGCGGTSTAPAPATSPAVAAPAETDAAPSESEAAPAEGDAAPAETK